MSCGNKREWLDSWEHQLGSAYVFGTHFKLSDSVLKISVDVWSQTCPQSRRCVWFYCFTANTATKLYLWLRSSKTRSQTRSWSSVSFEMFCTLQKMDTRVQRYNNASNIDWKAAAVLQFHLQTSITWSDGRKQHRALRLHRHSGYAQMCWC